MKDVKSILGAEIEEFSLTQGINYSCGGEHDVLYIKTSKGVLEIEACRSRINVFLDGKLIDLR